MLLLVLSLGCRRDAPGDTDLDTGDWDLESRPSNTSCLAMDRPATEAAVEIVAAYPDLEFSLPVGLIQAPDDASTWYVIEQRGRIMQFADDDTTTETTVFADIRDRVTSGG